MKTTAITADSITEAPTMETESPKPAPILNIAWTRQAHLDSAAGKRTKAFYKIRRWIIVLGVLATFFAIVTQLWFSDATTIPGLIVKILLVSTPITASILASFSTKFYANGAWLIMRAGSEEIKKEIFFYRTILTGKKDRRAYLEKRLGEIQRQLFRNLNGEFAFEDYNGPIPPHYKPNDPNSDPGFHDLTGDEYFRFRLEHQLAWHNKKVNLFKNQRRWMTIYILAAGGLGAIFAAWGGGLSLWVALTVSVRPFMKRFPGFAMNSTDKNALSLQDFDRPCVLIQLAYLNPWCFWIISAEILAKK